MSVDALTALFRSRFHIDAHVVHGVQQLAKAVPFEQVLGNALLPASQAPCCFRLDPPPLLHTHTRDVSFFFLLRWFC